MRSRRLAGYPHRVFTSLFRRFPGLRLAIDVDTLEVRANRANRVTGGVENVPVLW